MMSEAATQIEPDEAAPTASPPAERADSALAQALNAPRATRGPSILDIEVEVRFVLGTAQVDVGRLMDLSKAEVLRMNRGPDDPVDVVVNGTRIAEGELVEEDGRLGVRITRVWTADGSGTGMGEGAAGAAADG